LLETIFIY